MPLPFIFATLGQGAPVGNLDQNFSAVGLLSVVPCSITGTNSLTLTPTSNPATPSVPAYQNYMVFAAVAANTNTGSTTAAVAGLATLNIYKDTASGPALLSGGEIHANNIIMIFYDSSLNNNAGGFHLLTAASSVTGTVTQLVAGTGLTPTTITTTGTVSVAQVASPNIMANISGGNAVPTANSLTAIFDSIMGTVTRGYPQRGASSWATVGGVATGLSAAGASQGTATSVSGQFNEFTTVGSGQGAILAAPIGVPQTLFNRGANNLLVYPQVGAQIDGQGTNNPVTISTTSKGTYVSVNATQAYTCA